MITASDAREKAQETIKKKKETWARSIDKQLNDELIEGRAKNIRVVLLYDVRDNGLLTELIETYVMEGWTFSVVSDQESTESTVERWVTYYVSC